jgi:hypothetical protein
MVKFALSTDPDYRTVIAHLEKIVLDYYKHLEREATESRSLNVIEDGSRQDASMPISEGEEAEYTGRCYLYS